MLRAYNQKTKTQQPLECSHYGNAKYPLRRKASQKTSGAANVQGSREDASGVTGQEKTGRKFRLYTRG